MPQLSPRALEALLDGWRGSPGVPAYLALADRIRLLVIDGRIAAGARLPAERELAATLAVSRTTITAAYANLRDAGYLRSARGSGSVARLPFRGAPEGAFDTRPVADLSKATMPATGRVLDAVARASALLPAFLDESGFDTFGLPVLRERLAAHYTERGLPTGPDQIMVTIGAQHAIALLARVLITRGDRALVENPSYPHGFEALRVAGARPVPVSVTSQDGWDTDELEQAIRRSNPTVGYLMPEHHNPTGRVMPRDLRGRIADLADRQGTRLIVDETMAGLAVHRGAPHPPFAVDGPAITVGSVSKTMWGGLRVGWIRADTTTVQALALARNAGDLGTPVLEQLVVHELLDDFDRILDDRRAALRDAHDRVHGELVRRFPEWDVPPVQGGLAFWANLGRPVSSQLTLAARTEGLILGAGPTFGVDGAFDRFLRVPFAHPADETDRALDLLQRAWEHVAAGPVRVREELAPSVV